ncbi:MAG: DUF4292 domain-containing protein [Chlamydiae bacterium]|nr:DUF4292 domain-containing protein [Chlamydiota bacterium]
MLEIVSCKQGSQLTKITTSSRIDSIKADTNKVVKANKDDQIEYLFLEMEKNKFHFNTLVCKATVDAKTPKLSTGFSANIRIKRDSAIWVSISPALGIEVMRAVLTKDSVKFVDRINKRYYIGDYRYINKLLETEIDYELIEALLTGNNFSFYDYGKFRYGGLKDSVHFLSTERRRRLQKSLKAENQDSLKAISEFICLRDKTFKIECLNLEDFKSKKKLEADYADFRIILGELVSHHLAVKIKAEKDATITVDYTKIEPDKMVNFPFSVPDRYEKIH